MYIPPERRRALQSGQVAPTTPMDIAYLLYLGASYTDPRKPSGYGQFFERFDQAIERYMPEQIRFENFAIVFGSLDIARRELKRRNPQGSMEARKAIDLYMDDYFHHNLERYLENRIRANGDL